jgi:hypothetical protein
MWSVATNMYMSRAADKGRSPKSGRFGRGFEVLTKRNYFKTACYEALTQYIGIVGSCVYGSELSSSIKGGELLL